jgi:hypothetical protein
MRAVITQEVIAGVGENGARKEEKQGEQEYNEF